jgi:hypothetical protein
MKVKKLIEYLSTLDPELCVFVPGYEGGVDDVSIEGEIKEFALDVNDEWYYGRHEEIKYKEDKEYTNHQIVKGIIL